MANKRRRRKPRNKAAHYVYIMQRMHRNWWAALTFQRQYKIGISKAPEYRRQKVEEDVGDEVKLLTTRRFPTKQEAYQVEQRLHKMFGDSNFRIKTLGLGQAGETEWFYLTDAEYACLESWLFWYEKRGTFYGAALLLFSALAASIYILEILNQ